MRLKSLVLYGVYFLAALGLGLGAWVLHTPSFQSIEQSSRYLAVMGPAGELGHCTAVVIAPGEVLTANHCVGGDAKLMIDGHEMTVVKKDETTDLAVLSGKVDCPCTPLADRDARPNEPIVIVGFPLDTDHMGQVITLGLAQHIQNANYSFDGNGLTSHRLITTANIAPGNSGGPVFINEYGSWRVVGIVSAVPLQGDGFVSYPVNYLSVIIPYQEIKAFLDNLIIPNESAS